MRRRMRARRSAPVVTEGILAWVSRSEIEHINQCMYCTKLDLKYYVQLILYRTNLGGLQT